MLLPHILTAPPRSATPQVWPALASSLRMASWLRAPGRLSPSSTSLRTRTRRVHCTQKRWQRRPGSDQSAGQSAGVPNISARFYHLLKWRQLLFVCRSALLRGTSGYGGLRGVYEGTSRLGLLFDEDIVNRWRYSRRILLLLRPLLACCYFLRVIKIRPAYILTWSWGSQTICIIIPCDAGLDAIASLFTAASTDDPLRYRYPVLYAWSCTLW